MVVTARRIRSAIHRCELERGGLDTRLALAGGGGERPLSRTESGNGLAARRFGWIDAKEFAGPGGCAWAAGGRPPARDVARDAPLCAAGRARRMAARHPDWC